MSATRIDEDEPRIVVDRTPPRRGWMRRRRNRRITVSRASVAGWLADLLSALGKRLVVLGKVVAVLAFLAVSGLAGREVIRQVVASPRFAVREIRVAPTAHVSMEDIQALSGVAPGDRLLAIDPDAVAAQLTTHPWIASARVRRELPSALAIEVTEREAVATALLGALYLLDTNGRPFKRATFEEADGLPVITGVTRDQYSALRSPSEAVFREAIGFLSIYEEPPAETSGSVPPRPRLSEVHVDPRAGFTAILFDGGGEIRLGRGRWRDKLARLDRILAGLGERGAAALRVVHLDGPVRDRITVRLAEVTERPGPAMTPLPQPKQKISVPRKTR